MKELTVEEVIALANNKEASDTGARKVTIDSYKLDTDKGGRITITYKFVSGKEFKRVEFPSRWNYIKRCLKAQLSIEPSTELSILDLLELIKSESHEITIWITESDRYGLQVNYEEPKITGTESAIVEL